MHLGFCTVSPKLPASPDFFRCNQTRCGGGTCRNKRTFLFFLFPNSFRHRNAANQAEIFGAAKRAETANFEQMKKIIPLITCEISFSQYVCDLVFGVNVTDLIFLGPD